MKNMILSVLLLAGALTASAQSAMYPRTIEVTGKASRMIMPNSADISFTIYNSSTDGTKNIPVKTTEDALRQEFKKLGIKDEDFFSVTPEGSTEPTSRMYTLRLRKFDLWPKITALFDYDLVENIYTLRTDIPDAQMAALEKELSKDALAAARKKADDMAALISAKVKRVYSVRAGTPYVNTASNTPEGEVKQLTIGESKVELDLYVVFEVE